MRISRFALAAAAALVGAAAASCAQARDFYKGKTLTILVGYSAGGGFDTNARLLGHYIGRHIPGHPSVVVSNMPGAASLTAVRYLEDNAAKDGTVIDTFNFGEIGNSRMGTSPVKIDFRKFNWIGSISQSVSACYFWHTLGIKTLAQAKAHKLLHFGLTSVGTSADVNEKILMHIFGVHIQQVPGYPGSAEKRLAIERGELDGDCGAWSSVPADWVANKKIVPIIRSAPILPPDMPASVPYSVDIAPSARDRQILRFLLVSAELGRPFIASSAVPADRIKILRNAFDATMKDPDFRADAAKERLPVSPNNGAEALKIVNEIYATPNAIVAAARKIVGR